MANTGMQAWTTLEQYFVNTGVATGVTKPNDLGDPDYVAPVENLGDCPTIVIAGDFNVYCYYEGLTGKIVLENIRQEGFDFEFSVQGVFDWYEGGIRYQQPFSIITSGGGGYGEIDAPNSSTVESWTIVPTVLSPDEGDIITTNASTGESFYLRYKYFKPS